MSKEERKIHELSLISSLCILAALISAIVVDDGLMAILGWATALMFSINNIFE